MRWPLPPRQSGYDAFFFHLGGCKHGVISLVAFSWFFVPNKAPFAPIKGPLHSTLPRVRPIAPTNFYYIWPLNGWEFFIGSPMLPSSTSRTYMPLRPSLKSNIHPFWSKMPQFKSCPSIMLVKKLHSQRKFNCPHTNDPKFWIDHIWSLRQLGLNFSQSLRSLLPKHPLNAKSPTLKPLG